MVDLLKWSNFPFLDPAPKEAKIICFSFQTMKNDWVWRKVFERYITILNVLVDIIGVLFFQLVSIIEKLDSKFESFSTEKLKILNNTLIRYVHLFILNYPLQYAKRLVTYLQGKQQGRCVVWIISWALQIHSNTGVPHGTNQLV